jgi:hypothetical protein
MKYLVKSKYLTVIWFDFNDVHFGRVGRSYVADIGPFQIRVGR